MAKVHLVKEGKKPDGTRITTRFDISVTDAIAHFGNLSAKYNAAPPTINPEQIASDFAPYRFVVLEIDDGETREPFTKVGFYYLIGLTPDACCKILGKAEPPI